MNFPNSCRNVSGGAEIDNRCYAQKTDDFERKVHNLIGRIVGIFVGHYEVLSVFVFGCSAWFEVQGSAYKHETAAINLMNRTHQRIYDWMCPPSSFFVLCKDLAGRCFSLGIVAGSLGLVFLQRGRMIQRIDILEKEIQAMRTLMPR